MAGARDPGRNDAPRLGGAAWAGTARPRSSLDAAHSLLAAPMTGPLAALALAVLVFSTVTSTFLNAGNLSLIVQQSVVIGTLALGQTLVILVSGIDLANGAIMVLGTVVAGSIALHGSIAAAMAAGLLSCVAAGAVNGLTITRLRLPPFIATLGLYTVVTAGARLYTHSRSYPVSSNLLTWLGTGPTDGVATVTYGSMLWLLLTLLLVYALNQTAWGVWVYAIGNSPIAARLNGVSVKRVVFSVYAQPAWYSSIPWSRSCRAGAAARVARAGGGRRRAWIGGQLRGALGPAECEAGQHRQPCGPAPRC